MNKEFDRKLSKFKEIQDLNTFIRKNRDEIYDLYYAAVADGDFSLANEYLDQLDRPEYQYLRY